MLRSLIGVALAGLVAIALVVPALSAAGDNKAVQLETKLKGNNEVPGPGSNKGKGEVQITVKAPKQKLCFNFEVSGLDPMFAGHIHKGAPDVAGAIKVTLFEDEQGLPGDGNYEGCVKKIRKKLIEKLAAKPEKFYVNLHTGDYPDGAIRGQLAFSK